MRLRLLAIIASITTLLAAGAPTAAQTGTWNQAYGTLGNTGFANRATTLPVAPRWTFDLGAAVNAGGPSVATDGTIYVGTTAGRLWGIKQDGNERCSFDYKGSTITSTPAIVPGFGVSFLLQKTVEGKAQGFLVLATADCQPIWEVELPHDEPAYRSVSSGSVKVWFFEGSPFFFVHSRFSHLYDPVTEGEDTFHDLLVYDKSGDLFARHAVGTACVHLSGGGGGTFSDLWDWVSSFWPSAGSVPPLYETYGWPDSTPAISDAFIAEYSTPSSPLVAVTEHFEQCFGQLRVFQFFPVAPKPEERLVERWAHIVDKDAMLSSPAVTADGKVAVGTSNHFLRVYDLASRSQAWKRDVKDPLMHPPAIGPSVWIAGSDYRIHLMKPTGELIATGRSNPLLVGNLASPLATSLTEVVVPNQEELSITSHDLYRQTHAAMEEVFRTSHPALDGDGRLYVVAQTVENSLLMAF